MKSCWWHLIDCSNYCIALSLLWFVFLFVCFVCFFFFMLKLLQYCNYIIIVMQIKPMLLLLLETDLRWLLWRLGLLQRALKSGLWPVMLRWFIPPKKLIKSAKNRRNRCLPYYSLFFFFFYVCFFFPENSNRV